MTMVITSENEQFIEQQIANGAYCDRHEAVNAGLDLLRKRKQLIARLEASRRQLDNGEFTDFDSPGLHAWFNDLKNHVAPKCGATSE